MLFFKNQDLNIQHEGKKNKKERKKGTLSINLEYIGLTYSSNMLF